MGDRGLIVALNAVPFFKRIDLRTSNVDAQMLVDYCKRLEDAKRVRVGLISIETVNRVLAGGDENSPKDMGALVDRLAFLQDATGAGVDIVHHVPADGTQRLRGHGALLGACDITFCIQKQGNLRVCSVDKANDAEEGQNFSFDLVSVELHRDEETGFTTTAPVVVPAEAPADKPSGTRSKLTLNQQTMLTVIDEAGANGLTLDEWNDKAKKVGIGATRHATLYDARKALEDKGLVHSYVDRWYVSH
jgi:hypothetical protein